MKKIFKILPIIAFFSLIIGITPVKSEVNSDNFYFLENKMINTGDFIENGVRVEYNSKNNLEIEILIIKNNLEELLKDEIKITDNRFFFKDEFREINVLAWKEDKGTKVQISYINRSNKYTTNHIKNELEQIQNFQGKNIKYFNFVKVKIIEDKKQNLLDALKNNVNKETLEELNIVNGIIGKGELINGNKFNFSLMNYDKEEYLILGTPVIFVTY